MSIWHKMTMASVWLVLLATGAHGASSGRPPAGSAAPADTVLPTARVAAAAPADSAGRLRAAQNSLARLQESLAPDRRAVPGVLVIPAGELAPDMYDRIVEDLTVMSRIIEKGLRDGSAEHFDFALLGDPLYRSDLYLRADGAGPRILRSTGTRPKAMYVGGYGAIFSVQVAFPLVPPPETPEPNQAAEKTDQVWAAARRELLDPQAAARPRPGAAQETPYRAEVVEKLRGSLIEMLKHATNIRDLAPDSWLTVLVQGSDSAGSNRPQQSMLEQTLMLPSVRQAGRTLLTLRARKGDIDQYAQGQLDATQFQPRVQIATR
ncbi:MAG: hypothetical protein MUC88_16740 [Planctomycetes bacterium]|nr:hypothetical protein [Planctomycetota bacterium]